MLKEIGAFFNTFLFYSTVLCTSLSPGTAAWKLFKNRRGKVPLIHRDLICDTETLMALPKNDHSLDECTSAFTPFIPLLTLNGETWSKRRKILSHGLRRIDLNHDFHFPMPDKKGDIYWDIFKNFFRIGFEITFGRPISSDEFKEMYPGMADINHLIKRNIGHPDLTARWKLYNKALDLLSDENKAFIFSDCDEFKEMDEISRVSIVVEDLLTSISIQCSDLFCHLLLLYSMNQEAFKENLDHCINETLRLYPLTDIWTRKTRGTERGWIASLVQLNRNGWSDPDQFKPERWQTNNHPPLISWGFDARGCPATKIGYNITKTMFQINVLNKPLWIEPASNFKHSRTFPLGCQVWIGEGKPSASPKWTFNGKWPRLFRHWFYSHLRVFDQWELW